MIATGAYILVKTEGQYVDTITHKSLTLHAVTGFDPTVNVRYFGTVVALPTIEPFDEVPVDRKLVHFKIKPIIEVGDKVYFRYVNNDGDVNILGHSEDASRVTRVPYRDVFCLVRDGVIMAVGEWILGERIMEVKTNVHGLEVDFANKYYEDRAKVRYISTFVGEEPMVEVGDVVQGNHLTFENKIEGEVFYCFRPDQLNAVL